MRWSLRVRLTLAFVGVALVAVAAVALQVLPTLEGSMAQQRVRSLVGESERVARDVAAAARAPTRRPHGAPRVAAPTAREIVETAGARTGGSVSLLARAQDGRTFVLQTTKGTAAPDEAATRLAGRTLADGRLRFVSSDGARPVARVVVPVDALLDRPGFEVLLVSEKLDDVHATVSLVRRRVIFGAVLAILVALAAGALVAVGVSTRLRRLERGSREVAAGRFTTSFDTSSRDELGHLARSLDTMRQQLAELDGSRKRFIATASHELRTPLSSLSGFVELLRDEELDEQTRRSFLDQLAKQTQRLARLADDLLDLSRIESGGLELRPETVDLHQLAETVAAEFRPVVERDGRALQVRLVGTPVLQHCDPARVEQIIRILVDNALKHSDPGAAVEIRVARSGGVSRIAVSDRGPGVAPEDLPHLFEPFHGTGDGSGAGLGLAIARELAHRMRGELEVDSQPHRTTFTLELPA
ncbi:sensor histidine kinase [Patulibacter defluvii]|uniref:sensor histidine kinase n=1 Tax=Patulibacter defluvii TaxID=3095358 RepID=UPI002A7501C9|nr:HAMP domain-containing sensor histidine kinase [Patulibacter sp. DM4]